VTGREAFPWLEGKERKSTKKMQIVVRKTLQHGQSPCLGDGRDSASGTSDSLFDASAAIARKKLVIAQGGS
jgi:hypothetical protein